MPQINKCRSHVLDDIWAYSRFISGSPGPSIRHNRVLADGHWTAVCRHILWLHQGMSRTKNLSNHSLRSTDKWQSWTVSLSHRYTSSTLFHRSQKKLGIVCLIIDICVQYVAVDSNKSSPCSHVLSRQPPEPALVSAINIALMANISKPLPDVRCSHIHQRSIALPANAKQDTSRITVITYARHLSISRKHCFHRQSAYAHNCGYHWRLRDPSYNKLTTASN